MTERKINRLLQKFDKLDYSLQYWMFERFIKRNAKREGEYLIACIKYEMGKNKGGNLK